MTICLHHTNKKDIPQETINGMDLVFIGSANWNIYADSNQKLWSIPKPCKRGDGCKSTWYGDKHHIKKLMSEGYFTDIPTQKGLELLEGLHSCIITKADNSTFSFLRF